MIQRTYYVYIITNKGKNVLYTGVTNNLNRRLAEHWNAIELKKKTFAAKYKCRHLIFFEEYKQVQDAIIREKEIKGWIRAKKLSLIKSMNPELRFLEHQLF